MLSSSEPNGQNLTETNLTNHSGWVTLLTSPTSMETTWNLKSVNSINTTQTPKKSSWSLTTVMTVNKR